jgi:hypothetical protein
MRYTQYHPITGSARFVVRAGFSEADVYGNGLWMALQEGPLDAPERSPSGGSQAANRGRETHACTFRSCTCGGRGDVVHVQNIGSF